MRLNTQPFDAKLHHIARFEDTLRACFNLLSDEGVCAFGEPVLDAHAFASLLAQNIKVCAQLSGDELSHEERMVLNAVAMRAGQKRRQLEGSRDALGAIEDVLHGRLLRATARIIAAASSAATTERERPDSSRLGPVVCSLGTR